MAGNHLSVLTLGDDLLNLHRTIFRTLFEAHKWALVALVTQNPWTRFGTHVLLVLGVVRVADADTHMATVQTVLAGQGAATFRGLFKVLIVSSFYLTIWVILTVQVQSPSNLVFFTQSLKDVGPQFGTSKCFTVTNAVQTFFGTGQSNTDAVMDGQKANFPLTVAANQR